LADISTSWRTVESCQLVVAWLQFFTAGQITEIEQTVSEHGRWRFSPLLPSEAQLFQKCVVQYMAQTATTDNVQMEPIVCIYFDI
jgi:hypothetical protein